MNLYVKKVKNTKGKVKESIWISFYDKNEKRIRKSLKLENTTANWKEAELIRAKLLLQQKNAAFIENKVPTLDEFKVKSFEMNEGTRSINTQNDYRISYDKHIAPHLGHLRLDKIKPSHVRLWQSNLAKIVSPRRVKNIRAVLSGVIRNAMEDEIITTSPLALVRCIKVEKTEIFPFSMDEIKFILKSSEGQDRNFFALAFLSGMRSGEMIGLKWSDINFFKSEINIKRSRKMGVDGKTKTTSSNRTIDILDSLTPYLKEQYILTGSYDSYVFLNKNKEPIYDIKRIRETSWKRTLKACELDYRPIYHTRHSYATLMLENGEDILWVSSMLGHTDSSMTLSKYAHYIKRKDKKRAQFLDKELTPSDTNIGTDNLKVA